MTSLTSLRPAVFFPTCLPRPSLPPPLSFAPIRIQEPPYLHHPLAKNPGLGFSVSSSQEGRRRRQRRRGKRGGWEANWEDDAFEPSPATPLDLEAEIYEFMQLSANPQDFPTKEELLAAGRADLVEAIATQGGWLAFGWDLEEEDQLGSDSEPAHVGNGNGNGRPQEDSRISQQRLPASNYGSLEVDFAGTADPELCSMASSSGRSMEMEGGEGAGIEGILSRLENERSLSYAAGLREKDVNGWTSWRNGEHDPGDAVGRSERSSGSISSDLGKNLLDDFGGIHSTNGTLKDVNGTRSWTPDMWRTWSLQRTGFPATEFEAAEIVPNGGREQSDQNLIREVPVDDEMHKVAHSATDTYSGRVVPHSDAKDNCQNQIRARLQHLESDLKYVLNVLRSRTNPVISHKGQESSLKELHRLSDALEFQETEIMNARDKLRSTRAKLAVVEGKMALKIIEAQKIMEEKQKRLDATEKALCLLHTTCIVWPNSASEVLLAGSFDGWTSKRRMERSSSGIFSLYLKLYPGRYEIKFIVDGVWTVDPLRPTVNNNGHGNNLLIIP